MGHLRSLGVSLLFLTGLTIACSGSSPASPSSGSPPPSPVPTPGSTITGRIVGTVTNEPIAGATIAIGTTRITTDATGAFTLAVTQPGTLSVTISGSGLVPRSTTIGHTSVTIDVIQDRAPFDLDFFRKIARDAFEMPANLQPLQRLMEAPHVYLRTVDDAGQPIDQATLDTVERALTDVAPIWSGGRFGLAGVERGTDSRVGMSGWLTVRWPNPALGGNLCGRAPIGTTADAVELNYLSGPCSCGGASKIDPAIVRHELGHVFGYWHTGNQADLMSGVFSTCDQRPSAREVAHAKYLYSRPVGNSDPDEDPRSTVFSRSRVIIVD